jgi:hypothetical protein
VGGHLLKLQVTIFETSPDRRQEHLMDLSQHPLHYPLAIEFNVLPMFQILGNRHSDSERFDCLSDARCKISHLRVHAH